MVWISCLVISKVKVLLLRIISSFTFVPAGPFILSVASCSVWPEMSWSSTFVMMSLACSPAFSAGEFLMGEIMVTWSSIISTNIPTPW